MISTKTKTPPHQHDPRACACLPQIFNAIICNRNPDIPTATRTSTGPHLRVHPVTDEGPGVLS